MTYEDGAKVTTTMVCISGLFCPVFCMLTGLTAYQILRPMFDSYLRGGRLSSGGAGASPLIYRHMCTHIVFRRVLSTGAVPGGIVLTANKLTCVI